MVATGDPRPCLSPHAEGATLAVKVTPGASKTEIRAIRDGRLRIRVQAPPVEGKANRALGRWLAKALEIRPRQIRLLRGEKSSEKVLLLQGVTPEQAAVKLEAFLAGRP